MSDEETAKKILEVPSLPNVVKGDGRYLMSLLKDFLAQTAEQVNLANGFSADSLEADTDSSIPTPTNFFLTFTRLGASITWNHINDVSVLAYYELREDTKVGNSEGLLGRTLDNQSSNVPDNAVDTIYLYAVSKTGEYSNPTSISYTKPRPEAPADVSLTKNNEGTLITFLEIPSNCIGANIYINGTKYNALDNLYLFKHEANFQIKTVAIAYYDSFGEGERAYIYSVLPDITGFVAERNGAFVDFYWEPLDVYGVEYVVKVCQTTEWNKGLELFRTKLNKHRYVYPNTGTYYFLIKAVDSHNNYSTNTAYYLMGNAADIHRNVIWSYPQNDVAYSGTKLNMYYDVGSQGLKLESTALTGKYIMAIGLPQKFKARNWLEYKVIGVTNEDIYWNDADFTWDSDRADGICWAGVIGDINGVSVKHQIAEYVGQSAESIETINLNNNLLTDESTAPTQALGAADFRSGRWANGLYVSPATYVSYDLTGMAAVFNMSFCLKVTDKINESRIFMTLRNAGGDLLFIGYDKPNDVFYLNDQNDNRIELSLAVAERDWLTFAISQGTTVRKLFVNSLDANKTAAVQANIAPLNILNKLYFYPFFN